MAAGSVVFRHFRPGDERAVVPLLDEQRRGGYSLARWAWSFPPESEGRVIVVGEKDGEVASVCAGVPMRVVVDGRPCQAAAIRELVARDHNDKKRTVEHFIEICRSKEIALIMTSLDADPEALNGFSVLREDRPVVLERTGRSRKDLRRLSYRAEPFRDWEPRLDRLWDRVCNIYPVAVVRDAERALRRFAGHPGIRHHRFLVVPRFSREAVAAVVFVVDQGRCRWLDLVWHHDHPGALVLLSHISGRLVRQFESDVEELWLTGDMATAELLARRKFQPSSRPTFFAARSLDPQIDARDFVERVYLTSADLGVDQR
jgi:hypothetical protein